MARSTDHVVEVIPLMDGEDSPRRVLCPWRVPVRDSLENGGPADSRRQWLRPLTTDGQPCGEQLAPR